MLRKKNIWSTLFDSANTLIMLFLAVVTVYPVYYCVILSFNDGIDAMSGGIFFWPRVFTMSNHAKILRDPQIIVASRNSVLRALIGTPVAVLFTSIFAYAVSRPGLMFRKFYLIIGMVTMYFGGGIIPYFLMIRNLGLIDNFMVYIIPGMFGMFNAILFMSFFKTIPLEMEESAKIDGAGYLKIFFRIIVPVSTPVLATVALFVGVGQWNAWYDTMLFTKNPNLETLQHILMRMINSQQYLETVQPMSAKQVLQRGVTTNALQLAAMVITTFPVMCVYPFLQKYYVKGIMIGSLKG